MRLLRLFLAIAASGCVASGVAPGDESARHDIALVASIRVSSGRIAARTTMGALLRAHAVAEDEAANFIRNAQAVFDLRQVRVDQPYRIEQTETGALKAFEYELDGDRFLRVTPRDANIAPITKTRSRTILRGVITRDLPSLFAAVDASGGNVDLALALADIFSGEVDFNTDLQPGDRFVVVVDKAFRDDETFAGFGPILAARFDNDGRHLQAVRFAPDHGSAAYFDEQGASLRRFFLKSPLKFAAAVCSLPVRTSTSASRRTARSSTRCTPHARRRPANPFPRLRERPSRRYWIV